VNLSRHEPSDPVEEHVMDFLVDTETVPQVREALAARVGPVLAWMYVIELSSVCRYCYYSSNQPATRNRIEIDGIVCSREGEDVPSAQAVDELSAVWVNSCGVGDV
jgi:hypothetical protein